MTLSALISLVVRLPTGTLPGAISKVGHALAECYSVEILAWLVYAAHRTNAYHLLRPAAGCRRLGYRG